MSGPSIRRYGLNEAGKIFMLDDDQPDEIAYFANLKDHREVLAQRDALADALQGLRSFLGVFLCHDGDGQWRIALDVEPGARISGEAIAQAEAALRKAGR